MLNIFNSQVAYIGRFSAVYPPAGNFFVRPISVGPSNFFFTGRPAGLRRPVADTPPRRRGLTSSLAAAQIVASAPRPVDAPRRASRRGRAAGRASPRPSASRRSRSRPRTSKCLPSVCLPSGVPAVYIWWMFLCGAAGTGSGAEPRRPRRGGAPPGGLGGRRSPPRTPSRRRARLEGRAGGFVGPMVGVVGILGPARAF